MPDAAFGSIAAALADFDPFATEMDPILLIVTVLLAGALGGWLAKLMHVPVITGNILGGVLIGPSCMSIIGNISDLRTSQPLTTLAMGIITVSVGGHLSYRRIHNALRRILAISVSMDELPACTLASDWRCHRLGRAH